MRALVQRVRRAAVRVDDDEIASIGQGVLVLLGVGVGDGLDQVAYVADKIANLRIFADDEGKMNRSVLEVGGEALVVSQFTLYADVRKGRRPSFVGAAPPEEAEPLVREVADRLAEAGVAVSTGAFGEHMRVELTNDGPVTILVETPDRNSA